MTHTHRKRQRNEEDNKSYSTVEPGVQITCDVCTRDLTHSVHIKCADPACDTEDGVDICPLCFCDGQEIRNHKRNHAYRVMEPHNYPIFAEDWSADEENMLLEGILYFGLGNWQAIAAHIGGLRTKEEVEEHYNAVYIDSPYWPLPPMDREFDINEHDFRERKKARMSETKPTPTQFKPVTSAPGVHEVATFLPGRLEFEHELDNDAEDLVKDLEFGMCMEYGGDEIIEDENDPDVKARTKMEEERRSNAVSSYGGKGLLNGFSKSLPNGHSSRLINGDNNRRGSQAPKAEDAQTEHADDENEVEELTQPPPFETKDSLAFKLTLLEMYSQRVQKRGEAKALMFDRGLLDYKKMQANDKKRPREEKEIITRLRPFAKLQTSEDFEEFVTDILYEHSLRRRIQELQTYRRLGLRTAADIEQYEIDAAKRAKAKEDYNKGHFPPERVQQLRAHSARGSSGPEGRHGSILSVGDRRSRSREPTPSQPAASQPSSSVGPSVRKPPAPLNLANSPSLHLLTQAEQTLCSQLRILPKPYLVIKETLVREYARRGGKLRRREARDLVKIDVNKTSRVWDFLVQAGYLRIGQDASTNQDNNSATTSVHGLVSPKPPGSSSMAPPNGAQTATPALSQSSLFPQSSWPG
ncbi:SWIRM-domain-containing protein [Neolentinus lepideus HHB14362 ss-1]|uniref:Transcriptional adapter 2 n=1 Tax=Neolentinus lepideus HHB14362 ss-1 TaxID=1314782 RepID=A0A165V2Z4_9AGAM|nr:SWIRM-domain-containing protein [Neolentinus lepideus HHB14362 ss-1]